MNIKLKAAGDVAGLLAIASGSVAVATYVPYGNYVIAATMSGLLLYVMWSIRVTMLSIKNRDSQ